MADPDASAPAAGEAPPPAAAAVAPPGDAADAGDAAECSKQRRNRVKKLKAQYVTILELEQRAAAGQPLDAGQADKLGRKAAVAEELALLGAELPPPPPPLPPQPPAGAGAGRSAAFQAMEEEISQEEVAAALEKLLIGGGGGGQRQRPEGPISKALGYQYDLLERNPGFRWVLVVSCRVMCAWTGCAGIVCMEWTACWGAARGSGGCPPERRGACLRATICTTSMGDVVVMAS